MSSEPINSKYFEHVSSLFQKKRFVKAVSVYKPRVVFVMIQEYGKSYFKNHVVQNLYLNKLTVYQFSIIQSLSKLF